MQNVTLTSVAHERPQLLDACQDESQAKINQLIFRLNTFRLIIVFLKIDFPRKSR